MLIHKHPSRRFIRGVIAHLLVTLSGVSGCQSNPAALTSDPASAEESPVASSSLESISRIESFCGDCHALPRPESFPRDQWHFEIQKGYEFYARSGRTDLTVPTFAETLAYYRERAPEKTPWPSPPETTGEPSVQFESEPVMLQIDGLTPEYSFLDWTQLQPDQPEVLLASDFANGFIFSLDLQQKPPTPTVLGRVRYPGPIAVCDLDGDGVNELVVADLGSYLPADHDRGQLILLQHNDQSGYEQKVLIEQCGRVADVRAADFDQDGRLDLAVAEFGWHETGGIWILTNETAPHGKLTFSKSKIDFRPGTIHLPVHDIDENGFPDLLALISQSTETVELFLNQSASGFNRQILWQAPDLTFGFSSLELADIDQDGDIDLLTTNGDAFDNSFVSPWHGIQWYENKGSQHFEMHDLAKLPGAYRARAADFDQDGDMDILAVAWLPSNLNRNANVPELLNSIVYLEQTSNRGFRQFVIETRTPRYATLMVGDVDQDNRIDFIVGGGPNRTHNETAIPLTIWWNRSSIENVSN